MKASQAVEIAKTWVNREARFLPGFHAAFLSGSLNGLSGEAEFPDYSDIDVYCVMEDDHCFLQRKFNYEGALLETVSSPLSAYRSPEAVLSDPFLAHLFRSNEILVDPDGLLESIHQSVKIEFDQPGWLQARYQKIKSTVIAVIEEAGDAETLNSGFPALFRSIRLLSNLTLIANLHAPTVRRSICHAKKVLTQGGHPALAEDMLRVYGCVSFTEVQTLDCLDECMAAFDRAVEVYQTPISPSFNLDPAVRPYAREGSLEMIRSGEHREAMLWISAMHWTAYQALLKDSPEAEKSRWQASIHHLYAKLGLNEMKDYHRRIGEVKAVGGNVIERMDETVGIH